MLVCQSDSLGKIYECADCERLYYLLFEGIAVSQRLTISEEWRFIQPVPLECPRFYLSDDFSRYREDQACGDCIARIKLKKG